MVIMDGIVTRVEYLRADGFLRAYVRVSVRTDAAVTLGGVSYPDLRNSREPFDFRMHVFDLPEDAVRAAGGFSLNLINRERQPNGFFTEKGETLTVDVSFDSAAVVSRQDAVRRTDRGLKLSSLSGGRASDGVRWSVGLYTAGGRLPVRVYSLTADLAVSRIFAGTPFRERAFTAGRIQTVMEEAECFAAEGYSVLAAINADFFDMFGNCAPSGLCVSGGTVVANPDSTRPFFGILEDGTPVVSTLAQTPLDGIAEAVGGGQILLRDGEIYDTAPLEPFGDICHPRTAVGIRADGKVIFTVVDGRRPEWSNGASLTELAELMRSAGVVTAINLDGGGSSTFIVNGGGKLSMLNSPADLQRPTEDLVRPVFNSLVLVQR